MGDELRSHLARSLTSLSLRELETTSGLERAKLRQALEQLMALHLVSKEGRGLGVRYQLGASPAEESPAPAGRVIRRRARETSSFLAENPGLEVTESP